MTCSTALTLPIASARSSELKQASTLTTVAATNGAVSIILQEFKPLFELLELYKSTAMRIAKGAGCVLMVSTMELVVSRVMSKGIQAKRVITIGTLAKSVMSKESMVKRPMPQEVKVKRTIP